MKSSTSLFWVAAISGTVTGRPVLASWRLSYTPLGTTSILSARRDDSDDWYTWQSIAEDSKYASYNGLTRVYILLA